jgi:hypothetical protein
MPDDALEDAFRAVTGVEGGHDRLVVIGVPLAQLGEEHQFRGIEVAGQHRQRASYPVAQVLRLEEHEADRLELEHAHRAQVGAAATHTLHGSGIEPARPSGVEPGVEPLTVEAEVVDHQPPQLGGDGVEHVARLQRRRQRLEHAPLPLRGRGVVLLDDVLEAERDLGDARAQCGGERLAACPPRTASAGSLPAGTVTAWTRKRRPML